MVNDKRRSDNARRVKKDRRQNGSGSIPAYTNHGDPCSIKKKVI